MKPDDCPSPPALAVDVFGEERLALAERFAALLATDGVVRGLIGPRETPRLWGRHLINCALVAPLLPDGAEVADVGSGAGLPGLVLAIARADLQLTLIEPLLRRTTFLTEAVDTLGLTNVTVHRGRADSLHGSRTFDVVTSRAVAPLDRLLTWSMPLVAPHGAMVAMKGSSVADEVDAARSTLVGLGCGEPEISVVGAGDGAGSASGDDVDALVPIHVIRVPWRDPARVSWPTASPPPKQRPRSTSVGRSGSPERRGGRGRPRRAGDR